MAPAKKAAAETEAPEEEPKKTPKKKRGARKKAEPGGADGPKLSQGDMIREYLEVYHRCMREDPKSFDAKGALSALDQIGRLLGIDAPDKTDADRVILTLSDEVGERGD